MKQNEERAIGKRRILIALMEYLVILGCLITLFVMLSPKERIKQTSSYAKPEEVSEYRIVNDYMARIRPLSKYNEFKEIAEKTIEKNLGNSYEVKVYTNAQKTEEVTEGNIASGMIIECKENSEIIKDYIANVVGDITGNGDSNVTELTQIIRHIIGIESLNDEGKELSADFNGDSRIDVTDVSMSINYIVYGTMEKDKEAPLNPEIKVEGEGNK